VVVVDGLMVLVEALGQLVLQLPQVDGMAVDGMEEIGDGVPVQHL
jgi:hypothetical protein